MIKAKLCLYQEFIQAQVSFHSPIRPATQQSDLVPAQNQAADAAKALGPVVTTPQGAWFVCRGEPCKTAVPPSPNRSVCVACKVSVHLWLAMCAQGLPGPCTRYTCKVFDGGAFANLRWPTRGGDQWGFGHPRRITSDMLSRRITSDMLSRRITSNMLSRRITSDMLSRRICMGAVQTHMH